MTGEQGRILFYFFRFHSALPQRTLRLRGEERFLLAADLQEDLVPLSLLANRIFSRGFDGLVRIFADLNEDMAGS